jgi:hypothetical protein
VAKVHHLDELRHPTGSDSGDLVGTRNIPSPFFQPSFFGFGSNPF